MNRIEWPILSHSDPIQFSQVPPLGQCKLNGPIFIFLREKLGIPKENVLVFTNYFPENLVLIYVGKIRMNHHFGN